MILLLARSGNSTTRHRRRRRHNDDDDAFAVKSSSFHMILSTIIMSIGFNKLCVLSLLFLVLLTSSPSSVVTVTVTASAFAAAETTTTTSSSSSFPSSLSSSSKEEDDDDCPIEILQFTVSGCQKLHQLQKQKVPPSDEYWIELRNIYIDVVGTNQSTISWPIIMNGSIEQQQFTGIPQDLVEVKYLNQSKGRGIYAKKSLPKDTVVWNIWYHAIFTTECLFKTYLSKISWTQACDMLQWCYVYDYGDDDYDDDYDDTYVDDNDDDGIGIGCALDEGSLFNHAKSKKSSSSGTTGSSEEDEDEEEENAGYINEDAMEVTTLRAIKAGEELLQDYDKFETSELDWFTKLIHIGWGEYSFETTTTGSNDDDDDDDDDSGDNEEEL